MGQFHEGKDSSEPKNQEKLSPLPGIPITGPHRPTGVLWGSWGALQPLSSSTRPLCPSGSGWWFQKQQGQNP